MGLVHPAPRTARLVQVGVPRERPRDYHRCCKTACMGPAGRARIPRCHQGKGCSQGYSLEPEHCVWGS